jgi:hypothetical protein
VANYNTGTKIVSGSGDEFIIASKRNSDLYTLVHLVTGEIVYDEMDFESLINKIDDIQGGRM